MRIRIITLDEAGGRIAQAIRGRHPEAEEWRFGRDGSLQELFARAFSDERQIVCVMAVGIALRMAAPWLRGKLEDPAVVVIDDAARHVVSLVSGHEGGANRLAYEVGAATGAVPVITTGSEVARRFSLGIGCRRGAKAEVVEGAVRSMLAEEGLSAGDVRVAGSISRKSQEPGLLEALESLDIPALFFPEAEVAAKARAEGLQPSAAARHDLGVPSVAEPCALLAARSGRLRAGRRVYEGVVLALAEEEPWSPPLEPTPTRVGDRGAQAGRRGSLALVGLGPGNLDHLTGASRRALARADLIVGYGPYLELVAPLLRGKEIFATPMTREAERARKALDEALAGRRVAVVASGDSCVYGIGGIVLELATEAELGAIDLQIHPGITAAISAAALLGSPLENDFAVLSLSDLIMPREHIVERLRALAPSGLALALYNPRSSTRMTLLREAVAILLASRPPSTPAAIVAEISRPGERKLVCALGDLLDHEDEVDMTSIVLVASPAASVKAGLIIEPRGRDREGRGG